jgi:hypothetical protein|tara:strand:- start:1256 stop:1390 length:135 start_codon:yes stop_codon:yes gene_type:complete
MHEISRICKRHANRKSFGVVFGTVFASLVAVGFYRLTDKCLLFL